MSSSDTSLNSSRTAEIDSVLKTPVLFFLTSGLLWLIFVSIVGYITAWKAHNAEFLNSWAILTFGRVQAVYTASFVYGFGCNMAFAAGLWVMARLCGTAVKLGVALIIAALFWNLAVTAGVIGIFVGDLQVFEFLELPGYVGFPMLISSLIVSVWGILCFRERAYEDVYASQWFLLAAFLAFPWIQIVAQIMLVTNPAPGVVQALVASWFAGNLVWLWFGGITVATLYYIIPKVLGKPLLSYGLAKTGFLVLVLAGTWSGAARLVGGPFPAWIITVGITASILMLIFFAITGINLFLTTLQNREQSFGNGVLQFCTFSALALLVSGVGAALLSLRGIAEVSQYTILLDAHRFLILYGAFSMAMFAFVYYALPKILGREWPMDFLISTHFWISVVGVVLLVVPLTLGGWQQGVAMMDASVPFSDIVRETSYWLVGRSMAWVFLLTGHLAFALNLHSILRPECESCLEDLVRTESDTAEGVES